MTEEDLHIIESYLHEQLDASDKLVFEERLRNEPDLRHTTGQMRASIIAIRQHALDDKIEMLRSEENKLASQDTNKARIMPLFRWVAVAAAVIFLAIFLIPGLLKDDDTIKNPYLAEHFDEQYVLHQTTRGNNPDPKISKEQERAYNLYRLQKFHKAIPYLEKLWEEKRDTMALFYLNVSKVAIGEHGEFSPEIFKEDEFAKLISELKNF